MTSTNFIKLTTGPPLVCEVNGPSLYGMTSSLVGITYPELENSINILTDTKYPAEGNQSAKSTSTILVKPALMYMYFFIR